MNAAYILDPTRRIWQRPAGPAIAYSDGGDAEDYLLQTLRQAGDVSATSRELSAAIRDWPSAYHLSPVRHHLLHFLAIGRSHRVLELGCGCGAMTRFLGESCGSVVAVEGSPRRAEITAERCRDLTNVSIHCDNIADFVCTEKFDYVTLIGVLEYAPRFVPGNDPVRTMLECARTFLKPAGVLILAIENQLGLKYLNGCSEDHLGVPFYGIHGLYGKTDPVTFGRLALTEKLQQAGFPHRECFYPFPDYKLPQVILSAVACSSPDFDVASLLAGITSSDHGTESYSAFFEPLAWRPLIANGLLPELANSFLIVASQHEDFLSALDPAVLARTYSPKRLPNFATETVFRRAEKGRIVVGKRLLHPTEGLATPCYHGSLIHQPVLETEYIPGRLYSTELQELLARGGDITAAAAWAKDWLDLLLAHTTSESGQRFLPGDWLDAIPQNFVRTADGSLQRIDIEWHWSLPVPFSWLVIRGLINTLAVAPPSRAITDLSLHQAIKAIVADSAIALTDEDFRQVTEFEAALRKIVFGDPAFKKTFELLLARPVQQLSLPSRREQLTQQIDLIEKEIARIKSTVSWQVTKPLRLIANLPCHLRKLLSRHRENG